MKVALPETCGNSNIFVLSKKVGAKHAGLEKHDGFVALLVDRDINGHTKPHSGFVTRQPADFGPFSRVQQWVYVIQIFVRFKTFWAVISNQTMDLTMNTAVLQMFGGEKKRFNAHIHHHDMHSFQWPCDANCNPFCF